MQKVVKLAKFASKLQDNMELSKALFTGLSCDSDGLTTTTPLTQMMNQFLTRPEAKHLEAGYYDESLQDAMDDAWENLTSFDAMPSLETEWARHQEEEALEELWEGYRPVEPGEASAWGVEMDESEVQRSIVRSSGNIIMSLVDDPKHRDSQFLKFLTSLHTEETVIKDRQLIGNRLEDTWRRDTGVETTWSSTQAQGTYAEFIKNQDQTSVSLSNRERNGFKEAWDNEHEDWSLAGQHQQLSAVYKEPEPPLSQAGADLKQVALDKISQSLTNEAIQALDAHVKRSPSDSEAWSLLGRLHAENDEDLKAIAAFRQGYEADAFNSDCLLNLALLLVTERQTEGLQLLAEWLQSRKNIDVGHAYDLHSLLLTCRAAVKLSFTDLELQVVCGVLELAEGSQDSAVVCFARASLFSPEDYTIWNRLSAAMIEAGLCTKAVQNLYKALEMRPGYVRAWGNLALAAFSRQDYALAARHYLWALSLNPTATHLWSRVASCFSMLGKA
jgi:Flp pilus assembly protein TadD